MTGTIKAVDLLCKHDLPAPAARQSDGSIEALARETGAEVWKVQELYERELAKMESTAKVRNFLSLIALRKVRAVLCRRRNGTPDPATP